MARGIASPDTNRPANGKTAVASASPHAAANRHTATASTRISKNTARSVKPMVLRTASSGVRSRTDCIIMVAVANSSAPSTAVTTARMRKSRSPIRCTWACASSRSDSVLVSFEELAKRRSIASATGTAWPGSVTPTLMWFTVPVPLARPSS